MRNSLISVLSIASLTLYLGGCSSGPAPKEGKAKPTVFVKSHTAEKFKEITSETALWNGLSPHFLKDKQYMRCDMSLEAMAVFARDGFELVSDAKKADYTFDVTVLSCGDRYYRDNRSELPLQERLLYKDFMKWVNETEPSKLPADAKEIAKLISENNPEGFKRFYDENYIVKYGGNFGSFLGNWNFSDKHAREYLAQTKGIVLPNKYANMPAEDEQALAAFFKKIEDDEIIKTNYHAEGADMIGKGALLYGNSVNGSAPANMGGVAMGLGLLMSFGGIKSPSPNNLFKITNNANGKSWSTEMRFDLEPQSWQSNIKGPMDDWVIDEIPWGELN